MFIGYYYFIIKIKTFTKSLYQTHSIIEVFKTRVKNNTPNVKLAIVVKLCLTAQNMWSWCNV